MTLTTEQQAEQRDLLYSLLGDLPPRDREVSAKFLGEEDCGSYVLERLLLELNGVEPVPAYFTRPVDAKEPFPVVLFNHSHGGNYTIGKDELIRGREYLQDPPYAQALAEQGWGALAIDAWNFGERRGRTESELFKELLWRGQVLWGLMVYDSLKAIDYLLTRPDVDGGRIATLGMSMGSTMAWWVAALDPRVKVCIDICCLTDFEALIETRGLDGHGIYYYVPGLLKHFSTASINALIAPRPHLSLAGNYDRLTPPKGLDRVDEALKEVYREMGAPEAWRLVRYNTGHFETAAMRCEVLQFLKDWL
ncbi:MAG: alpha/beta hydrolase [Firmicutes bacterium]|nr:alpha/beta hydrolase [Bacillota bacterium]